MTTYGYLPWPPGLATAKEEPFSGEEGFEEEDDKEEGNAEEQPDEELEQTEEDGKNEEEPWPALLIWNGCQAMHTTFPSV